MYGRASSVLVFLAAGLFVGADPIGAQSSALYFRGLSAQNGLPQASVRSIVQDSIGFIWIGTENGLGRFDGRDVIVYRPDPSDAGSIVSNRAGALAVDSSGRVWMASEAGLQRYDPRYDRFDHYPFTSVGNTGPLSLGLVRVIVIGSGDEIWIGAEKGLFRFDRRQESIRRVMPDPVVPVRDMDIDTNGTLWLATSDGLYAFDPGSEMTRRYSDETRAARLSSSNIQTVYAGEKGIVWAGMPSGVDRIDVESDEARHIELLGSVDGERSILTAHSILEDGNGGLWIGTSGGLVCYDPRTGRISRYVNDPSDPFTIPGNRISDIFADRTGTLWVGTARGGVGYADVIVRSFDRVRPHPGQGGSLRGASVEAIGTDRLGGLWVATEEALNFRPSGKPGFVQVGLVGGVPVIAKSIATSPSGAMWFGGNGLYVGNPETSKIERLTDGRFEGSTITALDASEETVVWIGTNTGLLRYDSASGLVLRAADIDEVHVLQSDPTLNRLWIGTGSGLAFIDLERSTNSTPEPVRIPESTAAVTALDIGLNGRLWYGTQGDGLMDFDPNDDRSSIRYLTENSDLPSNYISGVRRSADGALWLTSTKGLSRLDSETGTFDTFGTERGILGSEFIGGSYFRDRDGRLYFGGLDGYNTFLPQDIFDNPSPPTVAFIGLWIRDERITPGQKSPIAWAMPGAPALWLTRAGRSFAISFAGLHFSNPEANTFATKLADFDTDWRDLGEIGRVTYSNVPPGSYTLSVRAASPYGVWSQRDATILVNVAPAWWQTLWFRLMAMAVILAAAFAGDQIRTRSIRKKNAALESEVKERTNEIEHKAAQLEVQAVKLKELDTLKSQFFANVSHELRTPLTLIRGFVQDVANLSLGPLTDRQRDALAISTTQTRRLQSLVEELLDLSSLQSRQLRLHAEELDLHAFLSNLVGMLESLAERKGVTLVYESPGSAVRVWVDPGKLEKVVVNLVSNAIKFTPTGGDVRVELSSEIVYEHTRRSTGHFATVSVSDSGIGISPDQVRYVFDRFYQVEGSSTRSQQGLGLGLAMAKDYVEMHGGSISVHSESGVGSTFTFKLPLGHDHLTEAELVRRDRAPGWSDPTENEPNRQNIEKIIDGQRPALLLVDDNEELLSYLVGHFEESYAVSTARNGKEALATLRNQHQDVILCDYMMPEMDGMEFLATVRSDAELATIPFVLLTARASVADRLGGLRRGADAYIAKPFDMTELHVQIENLLIRRSAMKAQYGKTVFLVKASDLDAESVGGKLFMLATETVERHFSDPEFDVRALAEAVFLSERTLRRKIRELTGLSAAGFIQELRLQHAHSLIVGGSVKTLSEAAAAVGFRDAGYFSKLYRAYQVRVAADESG